MIGAATEIKNDLSGPLAVLVIGQDVDALASATNWDGVDEIVTVAQPGAHFDPALYEEAVCAVAEERQVRLVLIGHTAAGMAFGPAVAARLGSGFASDVFGLSADGGEPIATRGGYGGKVSMDLAFPDKPVVVLTLRGATFQAPEAVGGASIVPFAVELEAVPGAGRHIDYLPAPPADVDIGKAEFILSVGRALGEDNESVLSSRHSRISWAPPSAARARSRIRAGCPRPTRSGNPARSRPTARSIWRWVSPARSSTWRA